MNPKRNTAFLLGLRARPERQGRTVGLFLPGLLRTGEQGPRDSGGREEASAFCQH